MRKRILTTAQVAMIIMILTMVSKLLGFVRELFIANYYGVGEVVDAFVMAQSVPDTLFAPIIQFVGTAFLPLFSHHKAQYGDIEANRFVNQTFNMLAILSIIVTICCIVFSDGLVGLFAPGFSDNTKELTVFYLRIASVLLLGNVGITVFEPYLRYKERYIAPVAFGLVQSISIIAFTIISAYTNEFWLIGGVVIGYLIRGIGMQLYSKKVGYTYVLDFDFKDTGKKIVTFSLPVLLGSIAGRINVFIDRMLASNFNAGTVSAMNYGHLISDMIGMVSYGIISPIIYPRITQAVAEKRDAEAGEIAQKGILVILLITIPLTLGAIFFHNEIITIIYERGSFDSSATKNTASIFAYYVLGTAFSGISLVIAQCFYAYKDTITTVICSLVSVAVNVILNFVLSEIMEANGLALATTISAITQSLMLYLYAKRKLKPLGLRIPVRKTLLTIVFAIVSVIIARLSYNALYNLLSVATLVYFAVACCVAIIVYLCLLKIAKFEEIRLLTGIISNKRRKNV